MAIKKVKISHRLNEVYDFSTMNESEALLDDIKKIMSVIKGTHPTDPEFGVDIKYRLFDPKDNVTLLNVKSSIESAIKKYVSIPISLSIDTKYIDNDGITTILVEVDVIYRGDEILIIGNISEEYFNLIGTINGEEV